MKFPGNIGEILQQAQQLQGEVNRFKDEAEKKTIEASSGGGLVSVTADGTGRITKISIDKTILNPEDPALLEDLVRSAVNEALHRVKNNMKEELKKVAGGFPIPGLG